jgi:hypothetical protein
VYKDVELARATVERINRFYPKQRILVRYDGTYDYINNCTNIYTPRLKTKNNGGLVTQTYLSLALQFKFDYLVKLDPDTYVDGTFDIKSLSQNCIHCNHAKDYIMGGLVIYPYKIAKQIHSSKLLLHSTYKNAKYNYNNRKIKEKISCQDLILKNVIDTLNIPLHSVDAFAQIELKKIKQIQQGKYFYHAYYK